jgi:hypothetical protein
VRVADVGGEEFDIAPGGFIAEIGDQCVRWKDKGRACTPHKIGKNSRANREDFSPKSGKRLGALCGLMVFG